ncbi:MAG TPA: flagellin, partial [bacterium]|nr:flagellin [bacterium]
FKTDIPVVIHCGANANQTIDIERKETTVSSMNLTNLNISTRTGAESSIAKIESAIDKVNSFSSYFGSMQNRLEQTGNYTGASKENQTSSESRIRDIDFAEQFMKYTKNQILHNASVSMLAQANINRSFMMRFL